MVSAEIVVTLRLPSPNSVLITSLYWFYIDKSQVSQAANFKLSSRYAHVPANLVTV